ncbi:MAG: nitroreductase family deazaflavin-dependent oxidoreductase [Deltaproteobacteria bacterium]|nr:nitroreductase family deazaflavin-dependent oxidoreductase [Deltaproteobacteria bacterium]
MAESAKKPRPFTATEERLFKRVVVAMSRVNTWIFRLSGGRFGARWMHGAPVMLLTTIGRKSGEARTTPLLYLEDGERVLLVGSQGGMSKNPLWVGNIDADPNVEIQIGSSARKMRGRRASAEEKARYWPALTRMYPDFADYQARTTRDIPVIVLEPR